MSKRKCIRCGKDPAEGFASIWANALGFLLLAVPVLLVFGAGLWVGRLA